MCGELDSIIRSWYALELVGVAGVGTDEIEVILFVSIEDDGLIRVIQHSLSAGSSLLILSLHKIIPLLFVIEQEVHCPHFGVYPLKLRISVKVDSAGKSVLEFWVIASDLECSMVVVSIDGD